MATSYRLSTRRLGEILIERGSLTPEQVQHALASRQDARERLGQTVTRLGLMTEAEVVEVLGEQFSLPIADAEQLAKADREVVKLIPESLARESQALAMARHEDTLEVAVGDPLNVISLDHLRALTGLQLKVWIGRPSEVREAIERLAGLIAATPLDYAVLGPVIADR